MCAGDSAPSSPSLQPATGRLTPLLESKSLAGLAGGGSGNWSGLPGGAQRRRARAPTGSSDSGASGAGSDKSSAAAAGGEGFGLRLLRYLAMRADEAVKRAGPVPAALLQLSGSSPSADDARVPAAAVAAYLGLPESAPEAAAAGSALLQRAAEQSSAPSSSSARPGQRLASVSAAFASADQSALAVAARSLDGLRVADRLAQGETTTPPPLFVRLAAVARSCQMFSGLHECSV